jgi:hypothetical protein
MLTSRFSLGWVLAVWLALAACSGGPRLIGAYPKDTRPTPYASPPANLLMVYNAYMELEVADPGAAAELATRQVCSLGGYLISLDRWAAEGRQNVTLTLAVPVTQFDAAHAGLRGLGRLVREDVAGEWAHSDIRGDEGNAFSTFTVQFRAAPVFRLPVPASGWNPVRTFEQAWGVFAAIFAFGVDLVIWVVVVGGPFALMAWGAVALLKKIRKH